MGCTLGAICILLSYGIVDGDTLRLDGPNLRVWGIDSVERGQAGYHEAGNMLRAITRGQKLTCDILDIDRFGRLVGRCETPDGTDIACAMVASGHARDWPKYSGGYYAGCE